MKTLSRIARSVFLPHAPSHEEQDFVKENRKHWHEQSATDRGRDVILVETALSTPASLFEKFLIAKTIERKTDANVVALLSVIYQQASPAYLVAK